MSQPQNGAPKAPATTSAPAPAPVPAPAPQPAAARPYRRFIIPSMHRRFTNAALLSLAFCGIQALWMGHLSSFWQIFGVTSLRALLLFIPVLAIYILRVANLHVGKRTTTSPFHTLINYSFGLSTVRAVLWYSFSAVFFCEVYVWSSPASARLSIIDPGKSWEPQRLNERPIFLRTMFLCLAAAQSFRHLYKDYDRASIPVVKPATDAETLRAKSQRAFWVPIIELKQKLLSIVQRSFFLVFVSTFVTPFIYWLFIRQSVWSWTFAFAKHVFSLPKSSRPPSFPTLVVDLLGRFFVEGFLLMLSWELANAAFDAYLSLEPLKQGRLLTDESQDPNGSLINGLKTNRPMPRSFAFWELVLVAEYMSTRRQAVYSEIGRQGGATWSQILTVCLGELHAMVKRIQPPPPPTDAQQASQQLHTLPRIAPPVKEGNIFRANPSSSAIGPSKPYSQTQSRSPNASKPLTSSARKLITYTADAAISKENQAVIATKDGFTGALRSLALVALRTSALGAPFRQTFARRAEAVIFTSPHSNAGVVVDAITAVRKLAVHSKKEDTLGSVYRDVPNIVRTFASTHNSLEAFVRTLDVHWTDVEFAAASSSASSGDAAASGEGKDPRRVRDVEVVLDALRSALREVVSEFGEYSDDMGLSAAEVRAAKAIAAKAPAAEGSGGGGATAGGQEMRSVSSRS